MAEAERLEAARQAIENRKLDALLITSIVNAGYLTGFTGSTAAAIITADKAVVMADSRYVLQASQECPLYEIKQFTGDIIDASADFLNKIDAKRIGFEESIVTYAQHKTLRSRLESGRRLVASGDIVDNQRLVKDEEEISRIRKAVEISDRCFTDLLTWLAPGMTEREVALKLEVCMRQKGAEKPSFESIVAAGPNSACPHHRASNDTLKTGELVKLDYGAEYQQYPSDITRTVVPGKSTAKQREIYKIVLDAQLAAIAAIRSNISGREVDSVARDYIAKHGYGENFGHGLGHSLGRGVHDGPGLSQKSSLILKPGMVMTVEPGIYIEGWGGVRIEDDVIVTANGCEILNKSPKMKLIEL